MIILNGTFTGDLCSDDVTIRDCYGEPVDFFYHAYDPVHFVHLEVKSKQAGLSVNDYNETYQFSTEYTAKDESGNDSFSYYISAIDPFSGLIKIFLKTKPGYVYSPEKVKIKMTIAVDTASNDSYELFVFADKIVARPQFTSHYLGYHDLITPKIPGDIT
jgi:hypothetical protein